MLRSTKKKDEVGPRNMGKYTSAPGGSRTRIGMGNINGPEERGGAVSTETGGLDTHPRESFLDAEKKR